MQTIPAGYCLFRLLPVRCLPRRGTNGATCGWPHTPVDEVLAQVPRPERCRVAPDLGVKALQRSMERMKKRAAGVDGWEASALLLLPSFWWKSFSAQWEEIFITSVIPDAWKLSRASLLKKKDGTFRPLTSHLCAGDVEPVASLPA